MFYASNLYENLQNIQKQHNNMLLEWKHLNSILLVCNFKRNYFKSKIY